MLSTAQAAVTWYEDRIKTLEKMKKGEAISKAEHSELLRLEPLKNTASVEGYKNIIASVSGPGRR